MKRCDGVKLLLVRWLAFAVVVLLTSTNVFAAPSVTTDLPDYMPGWTVTITGNGWVPGETVSLLIQQDPQLNADVTLSVSADANGSFLNSGFVIPPNAAGTVYLVTATGQSSHTVAYETFTDNIGNGSLCNTPAVPGCGAGNGGNPPAADDLNQHGN